MADRAITKRQTSTWDIFAYATGDGANSLVMNTFFSFAMLYYTKALGMSGTLAGTVMFLIMFWDAITDPLMGHISDNTRSRFGRRHIYMLIGGVLTVAGFYAVWAVPAQFRAPELRVVSPVGDGRLTIWDGEDGRERLSLNGQESEALCVAFGADGARIVSGGQDGKLRLWDRQAPGKPQVLAGHTAAVRVVAFGPGDRQIVSGGDDGTMKLWDARTGAQVMTLAGHAGPVRVAAISPDGKHVASGSDDGTLRLWDIDAGLETWSLLPDEGAAVLCVAFSPNGRWILSGGAGGMSLWEAEGGEETWRLPAEEGPTDAAAFSPDGRWVASGAADGTLRLCAAMTGEVLHGVQGHDGAVHHMAFSRDGRYLFSWGQDGMLKSWAAETAEALGSVHLPAASSAVALSTTTKMLLFWYLVAMNLLLRTGSTVFGVPYIALGFEVCTDYNQRTTLQGMRTGMNMAVNLIGPAILVWSVFLRDRYGIEGNGTAIAANYKLMGLVFSVLALGFVFFVVFATRKYAVDTRDNPEVVGNSLRQILHDLKDVLWDPYPRTIFGFIAVLFIGVVFVTSLQMYVYVDFMRFQSWQKSVVHGGTMVAAGLGALLAGSFVRRFDKKPSINMLLMLACAGNIMLVILFATGLVPQHYTYRAVPVAMLVFMVFHVCYHLGSTAATTVANSMMADVSEISRYRTGRLRDGSYSAMLSFVLKMAISVGVFFCGLFLDAIGFEPHAVQQTPRVALYMLYGAFLGGTAITLLALLTMAGYPVTREYMERMQAEHAAVEAEDVQGPGAEAP